MSQKRNNSSNRSVESYTGLIRIAVMVTMVGAMYISATFSKDGFSFSMGSQYEWMGWALSVLSIVVQLAWNRMDGNKGLTIYSVGIVIYLYSIYTNAVGIYQAQEGNSNWIFATLLGILLDIIPEPFFVWAWTNGSMESDPLGKMVDGSESTFKSMNDSNSGHNSSSSNKNRNNQNQKNTGRQGGIDQEFFGKIPKNKTNKRQKSKTYIATGDRQHRR